MSAQPQTASGGAVPTSAGLFQHALFGAAGTDAGGRLLWANPAFGQLVGRDVAELDNTLLGDISHPEDRSPLERQLSATAAGEGERYAAGRTQRFIRADGDSVWLRISVSPAPNDELLVILQPADAGGSLGGRHQTLELLVENGPDAMFVSAPDGAIAYLNPAARALFGIPAGRLASSLHAADFYTAEEWEGRMKSVVASIAAGGEWEGEVHPKNFATGERMACFARYRSIMQPGTGRLLGRCAILRDLRPEKKADAVRREAEARFRHIVEEAPIATCLFVGREQRVEIANAAMIALWGKDERIIGKPLAEALPELEGQPFLDILDNCFTTGETYVAVATPCNLVREDGVLRTYYFDFTYKPLRNAAGKVYAIMDMAVDVTEQVLAARRLAESEASLRGAVELAGLATWRIEGASVAQEENAAVALDNRFEPWVGAKPDGGVYTFEESMALIPAAERAGVRREILNVFAAGPDGVYDCTHGLEHPETGEQRVVRAQGRVHAAPDGSLYMLGATLDITDEHNRQAALEEAVAHRTEELRQSTLRLEEANAALVRSNGALQQFAYVASHDLQEPLRKISTFGDMLVARTPPDATDLRGLVQRMQAASQRASTLIDDLLRFSRVRVNAVADYTEVDLESLVRTVWEEVLEEPQHAAGATLVVEGLRPVRGDEPALRQLFANLLGNALKFSKPGEGAYITVRATDADPRTVATRVGSLAAEVPYLQLSVEDRGIGFDPQYAARIFDMFQRLHGRAEYDGSGIGLAIVQKVAEAHRGAVWAEGKLGEGSTFFLLLPRG